MAAAGIEPWTFLLHSQTSYPQGHFASLRLKRKRARSGYERKGEGKTKNKINPCPVYTM